MQTKRNSKIEVRVSYFERLGIEMNAQKAGLSISEYVRDSALSRQILARRTPQELEAYQNLANFKTNFSRISNLVHAGEEPQLKAEIHDLIKKLNKALEDISDGQ